MNLDFLFIKWLQFKILNDLVVKKSLLFFQKNKIPIRKFQLLIKRGLNEY